MFAPSREQARQFFFDTWGKYRNREVLSAMEEMALSVILLHPEYHAMLDDHSSDHYRNADYLPEMGATNPFLHMSMHLAIKEQLSIDQPAGICERFDRLLKKACDQHEAMHKVMECLGEMIWQAQRRQASLDASIYFECLDQQEN